MGTKKIINDIAEIQIDVRRLDLDAFENMKDQWDNLHKQSSADPLFLSWEWQHNWWQTFASELGLELFLLGVYDKENCLLGLAPCYKTTTKIGNAINIKRLQFIGNCFNGPPTVRTEYLDFIVNKEFEYIITKALFDYIKNEGHWDEFVIQDLDSNSYTYAFINKNKAHINTHLRVIKTITSYQVDTQQDFNTYIANLGKNTRKHLYKRRNFLNNLGKVTLKQADKNNLDDFFQTLNMLHKMRWGKNVFSDNRLRFHKCLAKQLMENNQVRFNILSLDDIPIAARINYRVNKHEYAIQSGINDKLNKKLSLGILLTGYMIENTMIDGLHVYDFLAGGGKKEDYKHYMATSNRKLVTLQLINKRYLQYLYRLNDLFRRI